MSEPDSRCILFVVGMHRSGTSALCAALAACGARFGEHLLGAMSGVNDEGFWEDEDIVSLNEQLLKQLGVDWYSVSPELGLPDWRSDRFDALRNTARIYLQRGFGGGPLEAVKDPRLCITLPFWLDICASLGIATRVLVSGRAPIEIARSLCKRDAFPLSVGLRLYATYRHYIATHVPDDTLYVTYDQLLADPVALLQRLADELPLSVDAEALAGAVRADLRHQGAALVEASPLLSQADAGDVDLAGLWRILDEEYPLQRALGDTVQALVERGDELTRIGSEHTVTLSTVRQRDAQIETLCKEHEQGLATIDGHLQLALATIAERDEQIQEFDRRLSTLGDEHSYALQLIQSRDEQLQRVFAKPGIGHLFRAMWKHETR